MAERPDQFQERELGTGELMCHLMHEMDPPFSTFIHIGVMQSLSKRPVAMDHIQLALQHLITVQPLLRTKITQNEDKGSGKKKYYFTPMIGEVKPIVDYKNIDAEKDWIPIAEVEMNHHFITDTGPLWKIVLLNVNDELGKMILLFILHHAICDGKAMADLVANQLLPLLNLIIKQNGEVAFADVACVISQRKIEEPAEKIRLVDSKSVETSTADAGAIPWYGRLLLRLAKARSRLLSLPGKPPVVSVCDSEMDVGGGGRPCTRLLPLTITSPLYERVVAVGRGHNVTVTSTIATALAMALEQQLRELGRPSGGTYQIHIPVDVRRFTEVLATTPLPLGVYVGGMVVPHKPRTAPGSKFSKESFWRQARRVRTKVSREVRKLERDPTSNIFQALLRYMASKHGKETPVWEEMDSLGFRTQFGVSNIGICNATTTTASVSEGGEDVKLLSQYFNITGGNSRMGVLFVCIISMAGSMHLLAGYNAHWIDEDFIQGAFNRMLHILDESTTE